MAQDSGNVRSRKGHSIFDFFISKFKQLWKSGVGAHLDLDSHAGQAWVGLCVRLGHLPEPELQPTNSLKRRQKTRNGPSRQRRRARRAAEKQEVEEIIEHSQDTEESIAVEAPDIESDIVENSVTLGDEAIEVDLESSAEKADPPEEGIIEQVSSESDQTAVIKETAENEVVAVRTESELVSIYATAVVEDSPYATLANEELESLYRFIASKEHLVKNIADAQACHLSSREFRNFKYKHTVEVKIIVKTANLWEGARKYIWRHLGSENTWTRGNGSKISLVKIHQK